MGRETGCGLGVERAGLGREDAVRSGVGRTAAVRLAVERFGADRRGAVRFAARGAAAFRATGRRFAVLRVALALLRAVDRFAVAPRFAVDLRAVLRFAAAGRRDAFLEALRAGARLEDFFAGFLAAEDFFADFFEDFFAGLDDFVALRPEDFFEDFLDDFLDAAIRFLLFKTYRGKIEIFARERRSVAAALHKLECRPTCLECHVWDATGTSPSHASCF
ncbi:MAG: hypothetical protein ABIP63_04575 [Thermoanaerobaculia bacterium]